MATLVRSELSIARRRAEDVSPVDREQLLALTLPHGEMSGVFKACANPRRRDWIGMVFIATSDDGVIVGWLLRWKCFTGNPWNVYLFVAEERRREGIGTALVRASEVRLRRPIRACAWDDASAAFFRCTGISAHDTRTDRADTTPTPNKDTRA